MALVPAPYLRQGLLSNATTVLGLAMFMLLGSGLLTHALALPASLLVCAGVMLGAFSILLGTLSLRPAVSAAAIWAVIAANLLWAAESLLLIATGWVQPTRAGAVLLLAQAGVAAMYAGLQFVGLSRSRARPA
jgi:hypothetical protein